MSSRLLAVPVELFNPLIEVPKQGTIVLLIAVVVLVLDTASLQFGRWEYDR